jgi:hypothetical protein
MRLTTLVLATCVLAAGVGAALAAKDEVKPFIHVPKTWEAAVDEAKTLNIPIVVHSHGWN